MRCTYHYQGWDIDYCHTDCPVVSYDLNQYCLCGYVNLNYTYHYQDLDIDYYHTDSQELNCDLNQLRNECLFFWVHGEWIVARDKQIAWTAKRFSGDLFVPRYDSFPMNTEKKTLIPYIYNASNKDPL